MKRIIIFAVAMCLLLTACGFDNKPEVQEYEPMTIDDLSVINADWSKLEPNDPGTLFTYFEPRSEDGELQAHDNYGALMTYLGSVSGDDEKYMYGLMTTDGQVVTEPVYDEISYLGNFIVLRTSSKGGVYDENWDYSYFALINRYTIAAPDGSWVHELSVNDDKYYYTYGFPYQLVRDDLLFYVRDDLSAILLNSMGEIVLDISSSVILENIGEHVDMDSLSCKTVSENVVCLYDYDRWDDFDSYNKFYMDMLTGEIVTEVPQTEEEQESDSTPVKTTSSSEFSDSGYEDLYRTYDRFTDDEYYYGVTVTETDYSYEYTYDLLDNNGNLIIKDCVYWMVENGLVGAIRNGYFCYYSIETGELVFHYPLRSTMD